MLLIAHPSVKQKSASSLMQYGPVSRVVFTGRIRIIDEREEHPKQKMNEVAIIERIIGSSAVIAKKKNYTYLNKIFPGMANEVVIICKKVLQSSIVQQPKEAIHTKDEYCEATDHDVTGSPLEHSFGEDAFDVTIVGETRNWSKDEEIHFPLPKSQASNILNICLEALSDKWESPLFVLSDASDKEKTIIIGAAVQPEWFTTMKVCSAGIKECSKIHDCQSLMREHCKLSLVAEREVKVSVFSVYEFWGSEKSTIDWSSQKRIDFPGYLSLELSWNNLSFLPPIRTTSNYLVAELAAGWKGSALCQLWDQLLLLEKYLTILEDYQKKNLRSRYSVLPLKFPRDFDTPCLKKTENVMEKLSLLMSGNDAFEAEDFVSGRSNERPFANDADLDDTPLLRSHLKELSSRQNLDFSDQLWQLVISSNDYAEMTDCIHAVFEEIVENGYKPQIDGTNPTRLAKLITEQNSQKPTIPSLAGSLPLELIIDMGVEKLSRDYTYLMLSASLADLYDIRQKLPNVSASDFSGAKYRQKLMTMAQIHMCLEFLILVQGHLDYSLDTSHSFFNNALKVYTSDESPIKTFDDLITNAIYTLRIPGSNAVLMEIAKASPTSWRATLSSGQSASKFTTTTYYSRIPIFPPNIYNPDDPIEGEEHYHVTTGVSCSYKMK